MGVMNDDVVVIQKGKNPGEPCCITVNCPDKTGLGCDICRIILDFGLYITKGDVSTDGIWCYIVLWVVPQSSSLILRWSNLKNRLVSVCPSCIVSFYLDQSSTHSTSSPVYLLKFFSLDRKGLLHDVTQVLCELELTIQRVKVMTTPDGRVLDLFFITDNMELLHTKKRQDETLEQLHAVLGESCISCELQLAGPEYECLQGIYSPSPEVAEELFGYELSDKETRSQALSPDMSKLKKASVTVDNSLSPGHTLLQIHCADHKGLLYDIMRTLKDYNIQIAYGRFSPNSMGCRDLDLFIQQKDGKKIVDPEKQSALCSRLKVEMLHPLRVIIANRGPDTELLVANPVELSGNGRPRVFYDVTLALKSLGICIFSAEIGRYSTSESDHEWEVYRFLLDENCRFQLSNMVARNQIVDRVRRTSMGCLFFCCKMHFKETILASLQEDYHYIGLVIYSHLIQKPLNLEACTSWPEGEKKLYQKLLHNFFVTTVMCQSVSGEEKIVDPCVSDIQLFTICHVKVMAKSCEIGCGLRINWEEGMVPTSKAYFPNFKELWKSRNKSVFRQNLL